MPKQATITGPVFLTATEVTELLRVSETTLRGLIEKGELPVHRFTRHRRFDAADVQSYIDANRHVA